MKKCVVNCLILFLLCLRPVSGLLAQVTPDYEREARWRAEVVPTLVVGDAVDITVGPRKVLGLLTEANKQWPAIVLIHGVGVHPDHGVIGQLRTLLWDAGYTTLSVQMPVLAKEVSQATEYEKIFGFAHERISAASAFLSARGYARQILLSHSMGSWMSNEYLQVTPKTTDFAFSHWICLGLTGKLGSTGQHRLPILDVQAENDLPAVLRGHWLRKMSLQFHPGSKQVQIDGADHFYTGQEKALSVAILDWIK
jgi:alpha/beta superfamily hydrolase